MLPEHAAVTVRQAALVERGGWVPLGSLLAAGSGDGHRLQELPNDAGFLRLGDVGPALSLKFPEQRDSLPAPRHVYRDPLVPDDCLLSEMVGQPRAAFAGPRLPDRLWVTDSWLRLRFRETPAARALLLATPTMTAQMQRLAGASSRRIDADVQAGGLTLRLGGLDTVRRLFVPALSLETRLRLDHSLRVLQARRFDLEARWGRLWSQAHRLFLQGHGRAASRPSVEVRAG